MASMGKLTALLVLVCAATTVQGQRRFPALIVMGDSLSDNGNGWVASGRTMPTPAQGYFQGRFTDGPVWSDYIENGTGINIEVLNTGYPGAQACAPQMPNAGMPFFVPYLSQQAEIVANNSRSLNNNRAVFIWVGANDLSGLAQALLGGQLNITSALAMVPSVASCIRQTAEGLLRFGITRSLTISTVQNIAIQPIWGVALENFGVPAEFRPMLLGQIGQLVRALNDEIRTIASELSDSYRRATVTTFDMYGLYYSIARDGPSEGITNVTDACLDVDGWANPSGAPYNNITGLCTAPNGPETHMFWDYSHPSTVTHAYLAERIYHHLVGVSDIFF